MGFPSLVKRLALLALVGARLAAQSAAEHIALGDKTYDERQATAARNHFLQALSIEPKNYDALWKASRVEVDLAEAAPKGADMDSLMTSAQRHAEGSISADSAACASQKAAACAEGHFSLARAIGRKALSVGVMDRIKFSKIVRSEALAALAFDSTHAGALHVLGMWNAEVLRVNGFARTFARTFLGAQVFGLAKWEEAQRLLEASVRNDPVRIVHHLDLAGIYADRDMKDRAREEYEWIAKAPVREYNDEMYKRQAAERLKKL